MGFFELFATVLAGFYGFVKSYGLSIILLTLLVRVILLPLSIKQTRSMREMQKIQPEIKKIQAKHKGDRQKVNEEMMALYKEHGVNPFGGCLPLLMQFPVMIGLYYVIREPVKYMGDTLLKSDLLHRTLEVHNFLGLRLDCTPNYAMKGSPTPILPNEACGSGFVSALPYLVLVLFMGFTTWYQQRQMMASRSGEAGTTQAQQMVMMGRIMPVVLMYFAYTFPSGVVLYWITTNLWTIGQQRIILRAAPPLPRGEGNGAGAPGKLSKTEPTTKGKGPISDGAGRQAGNGSAQKPKAHSKKKKKKR